MSTPTEPITASEPFDPRSSDYLSDPYARLKALRAQGPCVVDPRSGQWFLLGYDEVGAGLTRITRGQPDGPDRHVHFPENPFSFDGPGHTRPRSLLAATFANRALAPFRERAQQIVDDALRDKTSGDELRVIEEIGFPLPYHITRDILGVPDVENRDELRDWTWKSLELIDAFLPDDQLAVNMQAAGQLAAHLAEVLAWKRDHLGDDVFSIIIRAAHEGEIMQPQQILPFIHTLYLAGMHTTVNQTALSLYTLLTHRDQWELLKSKPDLLENAVEEILRFEPTAQYMRRTTEREVEVEGITIPTGTNVVCWIASANRDEAIWGPSADCFDITRPNARQHVAFGKGPHVCLGSWLARLELQVVLRTILERFPNSSLPDQELVWSSNVISGPEELVIRLES
jgi:cytochrome P450